MRPIITRTLAKIKAALDSYFVEVMVVAIILTVAVASYFLGRASVLTERVHLPIRIEGMASSTAEGSLGEVVATRTGKRWYYPWCATVSKLPESAKRHFASIAAAESAGLTKAQNCAGMK